MGPCLEIHKENIILETDKNYQQAQKYLGTNVYLYVTVFSPLFMKCLSPWLSHMWFFIQLQ